MYRSFNAVGGIAQYIQRGFSAHDDVTNLVSLSSTIKRTFTDKRRSVKTDVDGNIRKYRGVQTAQSRKAVSRGYAYVSNQCAKGFKSVNSVAILEAWVARGYADNTLRSDRQQRMSYQLVKRGTLSRSGHVLYSPITRKPVTSSIFVFVSIRWSSARSFSTSASLSAALESSKAKFNVDNQSPSKIQEQSTKAVNIRTQLRLWEIRNPVQLISNLTNETLPSGASLTSSNDVQTFDEEVGENEIDDVLQPIFEKGEIINLGNQRPFLLRGDMVELRGSDGSSIELAIFVRMIGKQSQYYTMSGKWIHHKSQLSRFCVPGFVDAYELDPLLPFLPEDSVPEPLQNRLQCFKHAPPRDAGSPLIKKMLDFWKESDKIYRETAFKIDNAHYIVAHKSTLRYATLLELANELLPKRFSKIGGFSTSALYALHRSLMADNIGFRLQNWRDRITGHFEISSIDEAEVIRDVADEVRNYQVYLINSTKGVQTPSPRPLVRFLQKTRRLIQESRKIRKYTMHGMIGPAKPVYESEVNSGNLEPLCGHLEEYFEQADQRYIRFIESWAALRTIQNHSHIHGIASAILRATGMYDDPILDQRVGWTFLQEIGAIAPWESRVDFDMRLSQTSRVIPHGKFICEPSTCLRGPDAMQSLRKDWGDLPVYCIDDIGAQEIDDGVSIESTDSPDEYWIHVHAADPASEIAPRSTIAQGAESITRSIYLPERVISMLPSHLVQQRFSLSPDRPCLTFSARINFSGELLDKKITPGVIRNAMYLTPATLVSVVGETPRIEERVITVGSSRAVTAPNDHRQLLEENEITECDKKNLKLLNALGSARQSLSVTRGSFMSNKPSFQMSVAFEGQQVCGRQKISTSLRYQIDPQIRLKAEIWGPDVTESNGNTVMSLMLLAGEVAARWCHERRIPIINRVSHPNPDDPDPRGYFRRVILPSMTRVKELHFGKQNMIDKTERMAAFPAAKTFNSESLEKSMMAQQSLKAFKTLPLDVVLEYQRLLGAVVPSTTAGPHLHLGVDMFTRVTSPLRRYEDLLTHWQIEAALLEEARSGQSLTGSMREDYLPFKRDELDRFVLYLDNRERAVIVSQRDAQRVWAIQLLVRAWKFNEAPLPATFDLVTTDIGIGRIRKIRGELVQLGLLSAVFDLPDWLHEKDIQIGDVFEVKLTDLDVYERRIQVEPLRRGSSRDS